MTEQHREIRITTERAIEVYLSSGRRIKARMVNLSVNGLAICFPAPGEVGAELRLKFCLPDGNDQVTINTRAIVRHCHVYHEDFITGLEFVALDDETSKTIANFIEKKRTAKHSGGLVVSHRSHR